MNPLERLRTERDELAERCRQLEALLRPDEGLVPAQWRHRPTTRRMLAMLIRDGAVRSDKLRTATRSDPALLSSNWLNVNIVILRQELRRNEAPPCFEIECIYGWGYKLSDHPACQQWLERRKYLLGDA